MPHREWQDLDDMLEQIDEPFFRFVDTVLSLRVTDFFFAIAMLLSSAVILFSPVTPNQVRLRAVPDSPLCASHVKLTPKKNAQVSRRPCTGRLGGAPSPTTFLGSKLHPNPNWTSDQLSSGAVKSLALVYTNSA